MTAVSRSIIVNVIEPSPLSFRASSKTETRLYVTYYQQGGGGSVPYSFDIDGQLRLTSRSNPTLSRAYSVPAIDVANGRAMATIPAGDISDPNGHKLSLYGSLYGEVVYLARGLVMPNDEEEPIAEALDAIDIVPITLEASLPTDTSFTVKLWDDISKSDPYDLGSVTVSAKILSSKGGSVLDEFTVTPLSSNSVQLTLTQVQVQALPASCWWTLTIGNVTGITTLCEGPVTVNP